MKEQFSLQSDFFVSSDGVRIHYLKTAKSNSNIWLVFLHGAGGDATAWNRIQLECFSAGYPSIAIDLRGHGLSDDPIDSGAYAFEKMTQDVDDIVSSLRLTRVVVVGHCFGGMTSIVLAAKHPSFLSGLVLVDTSDGPSIFGFPLVASHAVAKMTRKIAYLFRPGVKQVRPTYDIFIGTNDIHLKRFMSDVKYTSLRSYLFCYSDIFEFDGGNLLEKIETPTKVICGEKDIIFPPKISRRLAKNIKGSTLTTIPDANHIIVISDPHVLSASILSFVKNL